MSLKEKMDETLIPPSPNWFQVSGMAVTKDGWVVYGGPSKSLCFLEPLPADHDGLFRGPRYTAHVFNRANVEKIVSVAISPEWPEKRCVLTGSADGSVKHWSFEKLQHCSKTVKPLLSHELHSVEKEEIAGVDYSNEVYAITVGCFGNLVKWDLNSNIVKNYSFIKNFKPLCMACSPHLPLNVAVGTKQGVVIVLDLVGNGKLLYKVRGQDDEIVNLSWCPQYEIALKKSLKESEKRVNAATKDKEHKKQEGDKQSLNTSGLDKNLPNDSFDATTVEEVVVIPEDDMFDIYKDHEDNEFGHKKFQPEEISVKVKVDAKQDDYLAECLKLKEEILRKKTEGEASIQSLVTALDNAHVDSKDGMSASDSKSQSDDRCDIQNVSSAHIHKHLLATIGKHGGVRLWSKSGKLVGSCAVSNNMMNKNQKGKGNQQPYWPTLLWYKPDTLLIADAKNQLLECNPLKIDCKNKLEWSVVHSLHKRGIYCIASNAPRVQNGETNDDWNVYTVSQDRNIIQYSIEDKKTVSVQSTCGGFIYTVLPCPYDAGKIAVSAGDGSIRVWETSPLEDDETKLGTGQVTTYWQNVQGKVLVIAWHPTKENLLAFATAESRIGLLDISGKTEKSAKVLLTALSGPIYSICWGEGHDLYACANGDLVVYHANKPDEAPSPLVVCAEGRAWAASAVRWDARGLALGGAAGGAAVLEPHHPHPLLAATIVYSKMIHTVEWHPLQTSSSTEESPYKNLLATCSSEKHGNIVILEYVDKEDGSKQLQTYKTLSGHKFAVLQLAWNPHKDGQLLSTCQDYTVRVWDVVEGVCTSIFGGHSASSLGAAWLAYPQLASGVVSGGSDCALRLWDARDCPPDAYVDGKLEVNTKKDRRKIKKDLKLKKVEEKVKQTDCPNENGLAVKTENATLKGPKKFLLPILHKRHNNECLLHAIRIMLQKYLNSTLIETDVKGKLSSAIDSKEKAFRDRIQETSNSNQEDESSNDEDSTYNFEYLKIFGSVNDVNEILDKQMEIHQAYNNIDNWVTLAIFRGHIDAMIQYASQRDLLCPYLLSIAPCVSYKYWKDVTQMYLAQLQRQMAKGEEKKLEEARSFGGAVYRRVSLQLAAHDARAAVQELRDARLYTEAYILCRIRHMDSIAEETLKLWAAERVLSGLYIDAAIFYIILGNLPEAATQLGKMKDQESLDLAADIAKIAGQNMLADHISEKRENMKINTPKSDQTTEILEQLPSRIELLMKEGNKLNGDSDIPKIVPE